VPQGNHLHVLQAGGLAILGGLFPGLPAALERQGATRLDLGSDLLWYHLGGFSVRAASGVEQLSMSRALLEAEVRRRVLWLPRVACRDGSEVESLLTTREGDVRGVFVRSRAEPSSVEELAADLVVDASGRGSHLPQWLAALGHRRPAEETVEIGYGYTSRIYRQDARCAPDAKALYIMPTPPDGKRLGGLFPLEDGRWIVTLGGYRGAHAPGDERGFLEHARRLPVPHLHDVIRYADPLSEIATFQFPASRWRHYERLRRFPAGLLVIGDGICSFNPIYGQGMSVAAMEAEALDRCLDERDGGAPLARRFFRRAARAVAAAWQVAVGEDFRYDGTTGVKAAGTDLLDAYVARVHRASHRDPAVNRAFLRVLAMEKPPASLLAPSVAVRVALCGGSGAVGPRRRSAAEEVALPGGAA
jgi:2-polyprenyl-6-methoxyphenol hydroxylase-like FAD-dependent oxidoreductase